MPFIPHANRATAKWHKNTLSLKYWRDHCEQGCIAEMAAIVEESEKPIPLAPAKWRSTQILQSKVVTK